MQRRSHSLLAHTLLEESDGFSARRFEWAFLIGAVEPDCNPLSYLKGTLHAHKFQGHHYSNSQRYIIRHIQRLQDRSSWTIWQYYNLGKLTHYLADAYTYPHNEHYPDSPLAHRRYEDVLRVQMQTFLAEHPDTPAVPNESNLIPALRLLHERYMTGGAGLQQDCVYILTATRLLMRDCPPSPCPYRMRKVVLLICHQGQRAAHAVQDFFHYDNSSWFT